MSADLIELAGYCIASASSGYGLGLVILYFRKLSDLI